MDYENQVHTYHRLQDTFHQSYTQRPDSIALTVNEHRYRYRDLHVFASNYAEHFSKSSEKLIAIYASRSVEAYSGILGTLYSGKGYVPLNPKFPRERTAEMIHLAGVKDIFVETAYIEHLPELLSLITPLKLSIYLTDPSLVKKLQAEHSQHQWAYIDIQNSKANFTAENTISDEDAAYLLFTSGSTGTPKGVLINHRNVCAYIQNISKHIKTNGDARFSQFFDLTFDLSVHDLFVCWAHGGELCVVPELTTMAPAPFILDKKITHWFSVPSLISIMQKLRQLEPNLLSTLEQSFFCGEPLKASSAAAWKEAAPNSSIHNLYGPTEATIAISHYEWSERSPSEDIHHNVVSIGHALDEQVIELFNGTTQVNNPGDEGELCLSGSQVIRSYFSNPSQTDCFFKSDDNRDWYRTGDWAMRNQNDQLIFLGRRDGQVQVRGHRVELQEVEGFLQKLSGTEVVVVPYGTNPNECDYLCAFLLQPDQLSESDIMDKCKLKLPNYMVPKKVFFLEKFPLNASGKISRKELRSKLDTMISES